MKSLTHLFEKTVLLTCCFFIVFFNKTALFSQEGTPITRKIDSLREAYLDNTSDTRDSIYHKLLTWSKKIGYSKGVYNANIDLMIYHGNLRKKDSFNFYAKKLDSLSLNTKDWSLYYDYLWNKGLLLSIHFNQVEKAITVYREAYKLIPNKEKFIAYKTQLDLYISGGYIKIELYEKAIHILESRIKDSLHIDRQDQYILHSYLGQAYGTKGDLDKSTTYLKKAIELSSTEQEKIYIKNVITENYALQGNHQKAIDSSLAIRNTIKENYPEYLHHNSYALANYSYAIGNLDEAIFYIKHAIDSEEDIKSNELARDYFLLSKLYEEKGAIKLSLDASKRGRKIKDSIKITERKTIAHYYDKQLKEAKTELIQKDAWIKNSWGISIFLFIFGCLGLHFYIKTRKKSIIKDKENKLLKNEIKQQKDTLSTVQLSQKEQSTHLKNFKSELLKVSKNNNLQEVKKMTNTIDELISSVSNSQELSKNIGMADHNSFIYLLKQRHTELSRTDLKHCLFMYMGISLKDTAQILHISINTVKNARHRAKSKIDKSFSKKVSFREYLKTVGDVNAQPKKKLLDDKKRNVLAQHPYASQYIQQTERKKK